MVKNCDRGLFFKQESRILMKKIHRLQRFASSMVTKFALRTFIFGDRLEETGTSDGTPVTLELFHGGFFVCSTSCHTVSLINRLRSTSLP